MPRLTLTRRPLRAAATLAVAAIPLAACAGTVTVDSTSSAAPATSSAAAKATVPTPPATLAGGGGSPVAPPMTGTAIPGNEVADAVRSAVAGQKSVHLAMTTPAGSASADVDLEHKALRLDAGPTPVTLLHVGSTTWVKGAATSQTPDPSAGGRPWLQLRADGTDDISRRLGGAADIGSMLRPAAFADMLDGVQGDRTPIDGGTRTSFWVPADAYVKAVRGSSDLATAVTRPVTVVLELDDQNRPTRLTATMTTDRGTRVDDTQYSAWGQPVTIDAPPPDQVAPAPLPSGAAEPAPAPTGDGTPTQGATPSSDGRATVTVTATVTPTR